jgi:hypothetical protein
MKGKQKRKRNENKKDKKEQTSRQQQAEKRQRKEKQQMAVEVHKTHLLCLLAHHYHTNTQLEDELLQVRSCAVRVLRAIMLNTRHTTHSPLCFRWCRQICGFCTPTWATSPI